MMTFYAKNLFAKQENQEKLLNEYCKKSTQESIRRITEKKDLDNNINLIIKECLKKNIDETINEKNETNKNDDDNGNSYIFYGFLMFLSISSIVIYFNKRIK
jgi:hypothetical protein